MARFAATGGLYPTYGNSADQNSYRLTLVIPDHPDVDCDGAPACTVAAVGPHHQRIDLDVADVRAVLEEKASEAGDRRDQRRTVCWRAATVSADQPGELQPVDHAIDAGFGHRQHLDALVQRVRRLRGIAALKDLPPLGEVIEGVERAIRPLEQEAGVLGDLHHEVLAAGTDVLARAAVALRTGDRPSANSPETTRFASALAALESDAGDGDRIVPISELFYQDAGPHVVERAAAPATTPRHRFRADVVSLAEHLRRLVGDARAAADLVARDRMGRELRSAIRTLRNTAESFGESLVGQFAARILDAAARLERDALTQLDEVAGQLATTQGDPSDRIAAFLSAPAAPPRVTRAPTPAWVPPAPPTPAPPRAPSIVMPASALAPTGRELHDLLATGLAGLDRLEREPMAQPTPVEDDSVVPIDRLLYRGRAALDRAIAIRNGIRTRQAVPSPDELDELFDLLDLVGTE